MPPAEERLQKLLARAGYGSRRSVEGLIRDGRVTVDGAVAELGQRADLATQRVEVDGRPVLAPTSEVTIALHKPVGYVVSRSRDNDHPTVYELLRGAPAHLRYVGRLDFGTSGLLLLTTDGELAHRLTHPRYHIPRTYEATLDGRIDDDAITALRRGITLDDGVTAPAQVDRLRPLRDRDRLRITIHEGRNRQVRRMLEAVNRRATALRRISMGPVQLGRLDVGESRNLTEDELAALHNLVGLGAQQAPSARR